MATLERAIELAAKLHAGQTDKAGEPYILHPLRVMMKVEGTAAKIAAVLHDTLEDCGVTPADLRREGFAEAILDALDRLTKREGEPYEAFCERAGGHPISRAVKRADLEDNMDLRRLPELTERDAARLKKYVAAWRGLARHAERA